MSNAKQIIRKTETFYRLRKGDTIDLVKDGICMVVMVNDSRAHCVPIAVKEVNYETLFGRKVNFKTSHRGFDISPNSEVAIVTRGGEKAFNEFLAARKSSSRQTQTTGDTETTNTDDKMKKITKINRIPKDKTKARGGLAADAAAAKAERKTKAPEQNGKPSKCAFIDDMLESGKHTKSDILAAVMKAYPDSVEKATRNTINVRPTHMKKAGREAKWLPEPDKAA